MSKNLALLPRMSEKAYGTSETLHTYVFDVPLNASKQSVARAIKEQFEVEVESVNTHTVKGKAKRTYRKGSRGALGQRANVKRAYVRVKEGQGIPIFEAMKEEEAQQEVQSEKIKQAVEKKAAKEEKKAAKKEKA
jgi:ribosomal protein L23